MERVEQTQAAEGEDDGCTRSDQERGEARRHGYSAAMASGGGTWRTGAASTAADFFTRNQAA